MRCVQPNGRARTATVAYINDDGTVDLIYDSAGGGADGLSASNVADEEDGVRWPTQLRCRFETSSCFGFLSFARRFAALMPRETRASRLT